ncbi:hypothetical protein B0H14DRAFT_2589047 [Mycena olivaceomarginata]|nr:hypothetical protein B0H14DRAFT_2589047 [Mycena olivaceomarginata]
MFVLEYQKRSFGLYHASQKSEETHQNLLPCGCARTRGRRTTGFIMLVKSEKAYQSRANTSLHEYLEDQLKTRGGGDEIEERFRSASESWLLSSYVYAGRRLRIEVIAGHRKAMKAAERVPEPKFDVAGAVFVVVRARGRGRGAGSNFVDGNGPSTDTDVAVENEKSVEKQGVQRREAVVRQLPRRLLSNRLSTPRVAVAYISWKRVTNTRRAQKASRGRDPPAEKPLTSRMWICSSVSVTRGETRARAGRRERFAGLAWWGLARAWEHEEVKLDFRTVSGGDSRTPRDVVQSLKRVFLSRTKPGLSSPPQNISSFNV